MSTEVWMQVCSSSSLSDDAVAARYCERIDMVLVETGSGRLFMTPFVAAGLVDSLADAVADADAAAVVVAREGEAA
ncbi:hypothetical protein IU453_00960 [Nocardia cyriacigeorgica]|uniref:hypothetical protein n=1 Tax=Nocardia cyriacigeorgica TaxID=135487 RepID=UPI0018959961|nr:hypothetical protein [Nocardia cyriacigeorgica]MBF6092359.1 hypothetical protein [Nocardia cyriacigeorgica]MBF6162911.1 hypothetical protein [Nocardia cyriacigeorgica]MBF6201789.1 hypothetical protein [Nocardia cyriacigeorgica]MBF6315354.1 hypothetical protein [Nocardia cyriacigeorgica]MBF6530140.1 hypothetical protein [Nocardia cyriacigeorgica]